MICKPSRAMQISGANLLLASQLAQTPAVQPSGAAAFQAALKTEVPSAPQQGFEALPLKKVAAAPAEPPVAPGAQDSTGPTAGRLSPPGRNLDIRV